jgi:3-hydroxyisobutyrate dehydrogenase-like beta-hydroxyacid dehydrogenase
MRRVQLVTLRVAALGLGEAGGRIAADLVAAGAAVTGWDPDPERRVDGVRPAESASDAVRGADVVLSANSARAAVAAAEGCADALRPGQLFADLNAASPAVKVAVAAVVAPHGAAFVDVALMGTVPKHGLATPSLASGPGAGEYAEQLGPLGGVVEVVGAEPGAAAERKLLRSVFMKGLAAAIVESLRAAEAAGREDWLRGEIAAVLESADAALLDRLVTGSRTHAARRVDEMEAACELLRELGVEPRVAAAAAGVLAELAREQVHA